MAVVLDNTSFASGDAVTSLSWSHVINPGGDIGLCILTAEEGNSTGITVAGTAVTKMDHSTSTPGNTNAWFLCGSHGLTAGSKAVVASASFAQNWAAMGVSLHNVVQSTDVYTSGESSPGATSTGTSATPSVATVNSGTGELVLAVLAFPTAQTATPTGTGHTQLSGGTYDGTVIGASFTQKPGAAAATTDWTLSASANWAVTNVSFNASPNVQINPTGVASTSGQGNVAPTVSKTQTGNAATSATGAVSNTISKTATGVSSVSGINFMGPVIGTGITGVSATGAVQAVGAVIGTPVAGVGAVSAVSAPTVALATSATGVQAAGQTGTLAPEQIFTVGLTGVQGSLLPGIIEFIPPNPLVGVSATSGVGFVFAFAVEGPKDGRSHTDLSVRQWLEEIYRKEQEERQRQLELANRPKAKQQPRKAKATVRQAVEESQYILVETAVMRLAAQQEALRASLASLQNSFSIQSAQLSEDRARREEDDDDLLLFSAIL